MTFETDNWLYAFWWLWFPISRGDRGGQILKVPSTNFPIQAPTNDKLAIWCPTYFLSATPSHRLDTEGSTKLSSLESDVTLEFGEKVPFKRVQNIVRVTRATNKEVFAIGRERQ